MYHFSKLLQIDMFWYVLNLLHTHRTCKSEMEETRQEMMFESSADSYIDTAKKVCQVSQRKFLTYVIKWLFLTTSIRLYLVTLCVSWLGVWRQRAWGGAEQASRAHDGELARRARVHAAGSSAEGGRRPHEAPGSGHRWGQLAFYYNLLCSSVLLLHEMRL